MTWTKAEVDRLKSLTNEGRFFHVEIAEKMGKRPGTITWMARKLGLPSPRSVLRERLGQRNVKHKNFREPVFRYFLDHTWAETRDNFKLTDRELKSIFTVGYRMPALKHLRKETRRHDSWSARELKFLLTHSGLMPRAWIGKKLKRGTPVCIKERLEKLGVSTRTLNGITLSQFRSAFGKEPGFYIQTQAGPDGGSKEAMPTRWKIVPWVYLDQEIRAKRLNAPEIFKQLTRTMALFQEWIFEGNVIIKMKRNAKKQIGARSTRWRCAAVNREGQV